MIMEAERFHNLLSASWETKKAGGIIHPKSKGLKTRGTDTGRQEKIDDPAQIKSKFSLSLHFCSIWVSID